MLFSTIVYIFFAGSLYLIGKQAGSVKYQNKFLAAPLFCIFFLFAIISGLRYNVGVDYLTYSKYYTQLRTIGTPELQMEPLFESISNILANMGLGIPVFFGFWALVQISLFYYGIKEENYLYPFIGLVLILGPYYLSWMNGIRQVIVCCAFVPMTKLIIERKFIKYLLAVLICSLIHKSAFILIIFYFIPIKDYFKNRIVCIAILLCCAVLGQMAIVQNALSYAEPILSVLGYDKYTDNFSNIIDTESIRVYGPRRIVQLVTALMIIWFSPGMKAFYKNKFFLYSYNLFFLYVCLFDLFSNVSILFTRPLMYLDPFVLISTAYLLKYLKSNYGSFHLLYFIALMFSCSYLLIECFANLGNPNETSLYKSILFERTI